VWSRMIIGVVFWTLLRQACVGQTQPYLFALTLRGSFYETNAVGQVTRTAVTEAEILKQIGASAGFNDVSGWALVYHINGSSFGDTIDVVEINSGKVLDTFLGFFFGSDLSLGRMALTNAFNTQERRVDQLYTKQSPYALGSAFVTKRFVTDGLGNVSATIDADMHYLVLGQNGRGPRMFLGSFTTTRPFRPK
jgi:hypothetical protein